MSSNLRTMSSRYLRLKQFQTRFFPYLRHLVDTRWCTSLHSFNHYGKWQEIWDNQIRIETLWGLFTLCIWVSLNFQTQKRSLENPGQFVTAAKEVVECFQSCPSVCQSFCPRRGGPKWTLPMTHWISLYSPLPPPSGTDTLDIGPHCIETPWTWDLSVYRGPPCGHGTSLYRAFPGMGPHYTVPYKYWYLVDKTRDLFKLVHLRAPLMLTSGGYWRSMYGWCKWAVRILLECLLVYSAINEQQ